MTLCQLGCIGNRVSPREISGNVLAEPFPETSPGLAHIVSVVLPVHRHRPEVDARPGPDTGFKEPG